MNWVTPTDITNNIVLSTTRKLSKSGQKIARVVPQNSILVTCIASIGKNALIIEKSAFNQQINSLTTNKDEHDPYFLLIDSNNWSSVMKKMAGGLTFAIINKTEFSKIDTIIPKSIVEENKIGSLFKQIDSLITLHQCKLDKLKEVKSALLDKLLV